MALGRRCPLTCWRRALGTLAAALLLGGTAAAGGPAAAATRSAVPPLRGQVMVIAWHPLHRTTLATWRRAGVTAVFKLIGDFSWAAMEPEPGVFTFANWHHDLRRLRDANLWIMPSLEFLHPPLWFVQEHPHCLVVYGHPSVHRLHLWELPASPLPTMSLAWLAHQAARHTPAWAQFVAYIQAALHALRSYPRVLGVAFPWTAFNGRLYTGSWRTLTRTPDRALLADFNQAALASWPGPGAPPHTFAQLLASGTALERRWQQWTQARQGRAFLAIAQLIHRAAPAYWIDVDKHIWIHLRGNQQWMNPPLALGAGLTGYAFRVFLGYVQQYARLSGSHAVLFDDDALADASKIVNFLETARLVHRAGFAFGGESGGQGTGQGLLQSVRAVHPAVVMFLPSPGGQALRLATSPVDQEIICLLRSEYRGDCRRT